MELFFTIASVLLFQLGLCFFGFVKKSAEVMLRS
jgi:hypothetical protein